MGAVRGVDPPAARRHRHRARDRLGQVVAGHAAPRVPAADRPLRDGAARPRLRCRWPASRRGRCSTPARRPRRDFAEVVSRSRARRDGQPDTRRSRTTSRSTSCSTEPYYAAPLRMHDLPPISDGAAAMIIARGDRARELTDNPVWIRNIDHRIESHYPGPARSHDVGVHQDGGGQHGRRRRPDRRRRAHGQLQPRRDHPSRGAWVSVGHDNVNPSGGPLGGHPGDGDRAHPRDRGRAAHQGRRRPIEASPTRRAVRACSRTWSACWKGATDGWSLCGDRHRPDEVQEPPCRPLARRSRSRSGRCGRSRTPS